jgi:murein DD-endopeptidase MepM/ murein hydrolase activator NlpD
VAVGLAQAPALASRPAPARAPGFAIAGARVSPQHAYFAGRPVSITFSIRAPAALDLQLDIVREATGDAVRRMPVPAVAPGTGSATIVSWDGLTGGGEVAPNGRYRARLTAADGTARNAGAFTLRSHIYPIRGRHADRDGERSHGGFDIGAACGTPLVAARGGVVTRAGYDPVLYGNVVIVRGERTQRDYWYAHLLRPTRLRAGDRVSTGQRIGSVGDGGATGCHLHFEIRSRGRPIDAEPELHAWDGWS